MKLPVVLSPAADRGFSDAAQWYEDKSGRGASFVAEVNEVLERVSLTPESHAVVYKDLRRARVAKFPYNIFYRVLVNRVEIIAVVHGHRDPLIWQSRA